jgi:xanthine dehydrogenase small subunit
MGAFRCDANRLSIAFGGMAATPKRARLTEAFLHQHAGELDDELIEQACNILASEFSPLSDVRASAEYRMAMACNLLKKACYTLLLNVELSQGPFDHA